MPDIVPRAVRNYGKREQAIAPAYTFLSGGSLGNLARCGWA